MNEMESLKISKLVDMVHERDYEIKMLKNLLIEELGKKDLDIMDMNNRIEIFIEREHRLKHLITRLEIDILNMIKIYKGCE